MADFRRWITVLAVMALFVGLASAQVGTGSSSTSGSPFTCSVENVTVTPNLRAEGYAEQTGDIVLVCTGGTPLAYGTVIPTVNIQVFYNVTAVTSRLLSTSSGVAASEAVLLIDEPNNGAVGAQYGYGPAVGQKLCSTPQYGAGSNGCVQTVGTNGTVPYYNGSATVTGAYGVAVAADGTPGANVFQGAVSGASVTFYGVPVLPPVTSGYSRVFRITNVRVNANGSASGLSSGVAQVNASISISGATSLPITNPNPIVGYITQGLKTSVGSAGTFPQCNTASGMSGLLQFTEQFGTAFKTRVDANAGGGATTYTSTVTQNVPGKAYNSESNFILNGNNQGGGGVLTGSGYTAGLADYGTRLKAVFSNVPTGVVVYASVTNVNNGSGATGVTPVNQPANVTTTATSYAVLLSQGSEGSSDGTGSLPIASYTNSFTGASTSSYPAAPVNYVGVTSQGSPIVFVWEVVNTQPSYLETIQFSVWSSWSTVTSTFPPAGTSQVALSYGPTATNGAFSATNAGTTSVNNLLPRFADTSTAGTYLTINLCQTTLLFPYITTVTGFTTAISIANTSTDPFKTTPQTGTCALNWYQAPTGNPAQSVTAAIPSGGILPLDTSATTLAGANFSGYLIAVCNFQLAHGVAIVTDLGSQHILATYLALVVPTGTGSRNISASGAPEQLNN